MSGKKLLGRAVWLSFGFVAAAGCKPAEPPPPATPPAPPLATNTSTQLPPPSTAELPPGHPPIGSPPAAPPDAPADGLPAGHPPINPAGDAPAAAVVPVEAVTQFEGLTLTPPEGWQAIDPGKGMMAPVAAFLLPRADADSQDASARLTYFPGMKNIPLEQNLERWYSQVQQPDGGSTKDVAKLETIEAGGATITVVDMTGTIQNQPDQRLIAVVIEHPQGPHFLKVAGPAATVAKWRDSIIAYLQSAKVTP